jgi:hypothetical protein
MFSTDGETDKESTDLTSLGKTFQMVGVATRKPWLAIAAQLINNGLKKMLGSR